MKRLATLISLTMIFFLFAVPALAQETSPTGAVAGQYGPSEDAAAASVEAAIDAVEDLVGQEGGNVDGAEAYAAALNAAQETGVDEETAEVVAARAVAEVSEEPVASKPVASEKPEASGEPAASKKPEITELPDTGGGSVFLLVGGVLVGAGLFVRGVLW